MKDKNLNWKKFFLVGAVITAVLFSFGCRHKAKDEGSNKDAELKLKSLTIEDVQITDLKNPSVTITTSKSRIGKVEAKFDIDVPTAEIKIGDHTLQNGKAVDVKLSVEAKKGKYQAWTKTVKVTKKAEDPELSYTEFKIHKKDVTSTPAGLLVGVPADKKSVTKDDVTIKFNIAEANGKIEVENEPVALPEGKDVTITIKVPASAGKYKEWKQKVRVLREKETQLKHTELKIYGKDVTESNGELFINLSEDKEKVATENISVKFNIPEADGKAYVVNSPVALKSGKYVNVEIKVPADPESKYQEWSKTVKVKRAGNNDIELKKLKILGKNVKGLNEWKATVGVITNKKDDTVIKNTDIEATFDNVPDGVTIDNSKIKISAHTLKDNEEVEIKLSVDAVPGSYKAFEKTIHVTKKVLKLEALSVLGESIDISKVDPYPVKTVKDKLEQKDISAKFNIEEANGKLMVQDHSLSTSSPTEVLLKIEPVAKQYNETIIIRLAVTKVNATDGEELQLKSLKIANEDVNINSSGVPEVSVDRYTKSIEPDRVEAVFNYGSVTDKPIPISSIQNGANIPEGGSAEITLVINGKPGVYKTWSKKVKVKRPKQLIMESLKILGKDIQENDYNDIEISKRALEKNDIEIKFKNLSETPENLRTYMTFDDHELKIGEKIGIWLKIEKKGEYLYQRRVNLVRGAGSGEDPELELKLLKFKEQDITSTKKATVENEVEQVGTWDIDAEFTYGASSQKRIFASSVKIEKGGTVKDKLEVGENDVTFTFDAAPGLYKKTDVKITVTRQPASTELKVKFSPEAPVFSPEWGKKNIYNMNLGVRYPKDFNVPAGKYVDAKISAPSGKKFPKGTKIEVTVRKDGHFGGQQEPEVKKNYEVSTTNVETFFGGKDIFGGRSKLDATYKDKNCNYNVKIELPVGADKLEGVTVTFGLFADATADNVDTELGKFTLTVPGYELEKLTSFTASSVTKESSGKYKVTLTAKYPSFDTDSEKLKNKFIDSIITLKDGIKFPKNSKITVKYNGYIDGEYTVTNDVVKIYGKDLFKAQNNKHTPLNAGHSGLTETFDLTIEVPNGTPALNVKVISALFNEADAANYFEILGEVEFNIPQN